MTVDRAGSLSIVFSVITVFLGVVVIVGCIVGIGVVVGISIRRVSVSRIRPARMLAFNSSKSMRSGGTVMGWGGGGVARVGSVGCNGDVVVVGIGVAVGIVIVIRRVIASRIKPARMLAFSSCKSMCCGGVVMGWCGGGFVQVGSVGGNFGVVVVGIVVGLVSVNGVCRKSISKFSSTSVW